ncbi:MAG: hypothetical protein WB297_18040, partial [Actinomycetota bacterium]
DINTHGATPETLVNCLVFTPTTGGASLEGGSDGTSACDTLDATECGGDVGFTLSSKLGDTKDTLFHLVNADGILDCPSGDGQSQATEGDPGEPSSTLNRLENANGEPCTPIPYNLESGAGATPGCPTGSLQCILLQKDLLGQATQFYWTVKWNPESADYPETPTEFDFDLDGTFQPLKPCLADANNDGLPELPFTEGNSGPRDPWCVTDTMTDFDPATGLETVTETYFGGGDPGGKRA